MLILSLFFYFVALLLLIKQLKSIDNNLAMYVYSATALALISHIFVIIALFDNNYNILLGMANSAILITFIVVFIFYITSIIYKINALGVFIYPVVIIIIVLQEIFPDKNIALIQMSWHIMLSIISYSLLVVAFFLSILLTMQNKHLHQKNINSFINHLPPLQSTEHLLFSTIIIGFILLTLALISGFIFMQDIFIQHLLHKTVLSIIAWFIFLFLISGRMIFGWRNKQIITAIQIAFIILILAYFGSKFVLEKILS